MAKVIACLCLLLLVVVSVLSCDRCIHQSKLAYYAYPGAVNAGACGYKSFAPQLYAGNVAAAASSIFRDGVGCGACYQIRCKDPSICTKKGRNVIVTDLNKSNYTDFVITKTTLSSLAILGKGPELLKAGIVDVEYKRVMCDYGRQNLQVRVEEISQYPNYLALMFLKQGGQTDIVSADVAQVGRPDWHYLSRSHGAVWDIKNPPKRDLQLRALVTGGYDGKWVWSNQVVIPSNWQNGKVYDTGVQISDIAQEPCYPCDDQPWV